MMSAKPRLLSILFVVCVFSFFNLVKGDACDGTTGVYTGSAQPNPSYSITWTIDCSTELFSATITADCAGWVGVGWSQDVSMYPSDIIMGYIDNGTPTVSDMFSNGHEPPTVDTSAGGSSDLVATDSNVQRTGGTTTVTFSRPVTSADSHDMDITLGNMNMIWAYQATSDDPTDKHTSNGVLGINFFTGSTQLLKSSNSNLPVFHGVTMLLMWGLFAVWGAYLPSFLKGLGHIWYQLHVVIQGIVLLFTMFAFIAIEAFLGTSGHFDNAHNILGIIVIILAIFQGIIGFLANRYYDPKRTSAPIWPDRVHGVLGAVILFFAFIAMLLGLVKIGCATPATLGCLVVWLIFNIALHIVLRIYFKKHPIAVLHVDSEHDNAYHAYEDDDTIKHEYEQENDSQSQKASGDFKSKVQVNKVPLIIFFTQFLLGFVLVGICMNEVTKRGGYYV